MAETSATSSAGSSIVQALSMGSGVDIQELATTLAQAENQPRIDTISRKKEETTVSVSGYGQLKASLSLMKTAFDNLKNVSDVTNKTVTNPNPTALSLAVSKQNDLAAGSYDVSIERLAKSAIVASDEFTSQTQSLNSGTAFDISFSVGSPSPSTTTVNVATDTPAGVVAAVNAADIGISARLINKSATGNEWVVLFEGETGVENSFTASSSPDLGLEDTANQLQQAQNSSITVNGLDAIERAGNKIGDVIPGLELELATLESTPIRISIAEDSSVLRAAIEDIVLTYNAFRETTTTLTTEDAETGEAGALEKDKTFVSMIQAQIKSLLDKESSTPSGGLSTLRDIGLRVQLSGELAIDETTFSKVIADNLADVRTLLTADTDNQTDFDGGNKGLALDSSLVLKGMLDKSGAISSRQATAETKIEDYEKRLEALEKRLEAAQQRYLTQFAAMESLVQRSKSTGDYLKGQFTAMENMYKS